jgi:hypothetical protein
MSTHEKDVIDSTKTDVTTISHHIMMDLLRVTMLVYNYGDSFQVTDNNKDIETFVSSMKAKGEFDKIKMDDTRKHILEEIALNVPTGKLYKFITDPVTDIQVGIAVSKGKKRISIVFRGSESLSDWYYDFMVFKHKLKDSVYVHSGFYTQLTTNNVCEELITSVESILSEHPDYHVYVTGHSLGGALSTLFGYILANKIENIVKVVSFASPRVGNYGWKKSFEETKNLIHYRITNKRDIVTAFPIYKYYHVGINVQLSDEKYKIVDKSNLKWYNETLITCWSPSEHSCDLYYNRMNKNKW